MALHIVNKVLMFCLFLASLLALKGRKARHITGRIALNIFLHKQPLQRLHDKKTYIAIVKYYGVFYFPVFGWKKQQSEKLTC